MLIVAGLAAATVALSVAAALSASRPASAGPRRDAARFGTREGRGRLAWLGWPLLAAALSLALLAAGLRVAPAGATLALGSRLTLQAPRLLALLALLPWLAPLVRRSLTDLSGAQLAVQTAVRALLLVLCTLGLCRPALTGQRQSVEEVVLLDVSPSMSDPQVAAGAAQVEALRQEAGRRGDRLHLITFAGRPTVVPLPPAGQPLPPLRPPGERRDGAGAATSAATQDAATRIQGALQLAYGLFSPGVLRRVLLFSDGNQTEGDVLAEVQEARRRGVRSDARPVQVEGSEEVLVRSLRLAGEQGGAVRVGAPFSLEAEIYATSAQTVRVTLLRDGAENPGDGHREVALVPGRNLVRFRGEAHQAGYSTFKVVLSAENSPPPAAPPRDRFAGNNQAVLSLAVKGRPRVLYVEGEPRARGYLTQALQREDIEVDVQDAYGLPQSARDLARYDLLILSDVPSVMLSQAHMQAIESYVRDLGGGFVMAGGENSFGSGGYQGTLLERVLPVRFDQEKKRDQPTLALELVIDRSGSMNGPKLELAKDAARATVSMLGGDDLIGVIAFDSQATALVRLQRAQNRVRISTDIARLQAGGGTQFLPALQEAFSQLVAANAKVKHVILLTDGQAEYQGILELVEQMVEQKITISAVGVGTGADQTLLTAIAEHGGGRFYFTQDATSIPKIFTKETAQVARSALVEDAVRVVVEKRVEMLDGVGIEGAPPLRGYVATKAKPLAERILGTSQGEPLLVRWRVGLGQSLAFASDVKNRWAVDWLRWPGYSRFWAQLVRSSMRHDPHTRGAGYDLTATADPPQVHVAVDAVGSDDRFLSGLQTTLEVLEPGTVVPGRPSAPPLLQVPMIQSAPGRYEADFTLSRYGAFLLRAVHRSRPAAVTAGSAGPIVAESWGTLALSYPREFLALPPDLPLLAAVAQAGEGRLYGAAQDAGEVARLALDPGDEKVTFLRELWPYLIGAAAALLLLDVLLRRVRLLGYRPLQTE